MITKPTVSNDQESTLESLGRITLAHYESFESFAGLLKTQAIGFCETPTYENLSAVKEVWWNARTPWKRAEVVYFGPVLELPTRFRFKIDNSLAHPDEIEAFIASDQGLTQADISAGRLSTRGLPVIEYLLWNEADNTLATFRDDPRRCSYLIGLATDLEINAGQLVDAWKYEWMPQLIDPENTPNSVYSSTEDVLDEWVNHMTITVETIRKDRLGRSIGCDSRDDIESLASARSLRDARDTLDGVYILWTGDTDEDNPGIIDLVRSPVLVELIENLFVDAKNQLAAIPEPLEMTILNQPEFIIKAQESLKKLQIGLHLDLMSALGVQFYFSDLDDDCQRLDYLTR